MQEITGEPSLPKLQEILQNDEAKPGSDDLKQQ